MHKLTMIMSYCSLHLMDNFIAGTSELTMLPSVCLLWLIYRTAQRKCGTADTTLTAKAALFLVDFRFLWMEELSGANSGNLVPPPPASFLGEGGLPQGSVGRHRMACSGLLPLLVILALEIGALQGVFFWQKQLQAGNQLFDDVISHLRNIHGRTIPKHWTK